MPTLAELLGMAPQGGVAQSQNPNLQRILMAARMRQRMPMTPEQEQAEAASRAAAQFMGARG